MSCELNLLLLSGNLVADPKVRVVKNDRMVVHFTMASNRRYKTADGLPKDEVLFIDCEAWGRTAELVGQYLVKGSPCLVQGRLQLHCWEDPKGGRRSKIEVVADRVQFMPRSHREAAEDGPHASEDQEAANPPTTGSRPSAARSSRPAPVPVPVGAGDDEPPF